VREHLARDDLRRAGTPAEEDADVVDRIEALAPEWVHAMHGGTLTQAALPSYIRALREQRFAFEGTLLGRKVVPDDADVVTE